MNRNIIKKLAPESLKRIDDKRCPCCNAKISDAGFTDIISFKEYKISGMCQKCQDSVFDLSGSKEDPEE